MEIIDNDTLESRYRFPGNLKLPIEIVNDLPENQKKNILDRLEHLKDNLQEMLKGESSGCFKYEVSVDVNLFVDYKKGEVNFYLEDDINNCYTQSMDLPIATEIADKESKILKKLEIYLQEDLTQKRKNNLTSTLIHSSYESRINNRGSPTVFGRKLSDDFDLDQ